MKSSEIRRGIKPAEQPAVEKSDGFFRNLLTGLKVTAVIGLAFGVRGWFKAQEKAFESSGLTAAPNAPRAQTGATIEDVQRTLKEIEQRLDVQANPENLTGKRQGPMTR